MFGLGPTELILIVVLVLIVFGAGKLPQVFNQLGKGIKEFRDASEGSSETTTTSTITTVTPTNTVTPANATVPPATVPGASVTETRRETTNSGQ